MSFKFQFEDEPGSDERTTKAVQWHGWECVKKPRSVTDDMELE